MVIDSLLNTNVKKKNGTSSTSTDVGNKEESDHKLKLVNGILRSVDKGTITFERAKATVSALYESVENGKIKFSDFDQNPMYDKLCKILSQGSKKKVGNMASMKNHLASKNFVPLDFYSFNESYNDIEKISTAQAIELLLNVTLKQRRIKPLLNAIAYNINQSQTQLTIKNISDILYCMAMLSFPDPGLLCKLVNDLKGSLKTISQSSMIGSIITSLGILRYRDDALLNQISEWVVQNKNILRSQDLSALMITLATVGYTPSNSDVLFSVCKYFYY